MYWKYQYYLPCSFLSTGETVMNKIVKKSLPPWSLYSLYANHHAATWKNGPKVKLYLQNYNIQLRIVNEVKWSEVAQSCPTLCDPMDCSLPGSSVHGIFQAIVLEWIAISFSGGSSGPRDRTQVSLIVDKRFTAWATREALDMLYSSNKKHSPILRTLQDWLYNYQWLSFFSNTYLQTHSLRAAPENSVLFIFSPLHLAQVLRHSKYSIKVH